MPLLLLMLACGPEVTLTSDSPFCTDIDLQDPPPAELTWAQDGTMVIVKLEPVFQSCDAVFDPEFVAEGHLVQVYEGWTDESGGACCMAPEVHMVADRGWTWELEWFGLDGEKAHTLEIDSR